ncbi:hypothetical protein GCM10009001_03980 [Virgibacillus siamensis]|uniref:NERD domain-containing protein n=1 Tax=Virgibacillus siamensis TaxID=480071 RepID=A0ABP3QHQ1_9BACI
MKKIVIVAFVVTILWILLMTFNPLYVISGSMLTGALVLQHKFPEMKGALGEWQVRRLLQKLDTEKYTLYDDLYLTRDDGRTVQIDHVVTSAFGVFVIETKHYNGWIFGKETQQNWTQVIYKRKEKLYNPIWQNYGHIQTLKSSLNKEDMKSVFSIIAFSDQSTLKIEDNFKNARVIQFRQLIDVIKASHVRVINEAELTEINRTMGSLVITDKKAKKKIKKQHVQSIKRERKQTGRTTKKKLRQNICPKCGGELSVKNGKYGAFYGCSNFPKCRFTGKVS